MQFCEKCGGLIVISENKNACASCGHKVKKVKIESSEKMDNKEQIAVINEEAGNTYPEVDMLCPKCKNKKAFFWTIQTRAGDESETKFYKCTKCKHTWRKYR
jgi:DNA-directed RNA polymerase subunit M